jgi:hypothetical protein
VKEILDHMAETLADGGRIEIRGFGSFTLHHHPTRQGRNPKTGESVDVDNLCRVRFKPGLDCGSGSTPRPEPPSSSKPPCHGPSVGHEKKPVSPLTRLNFVF